MKKSILAIMGIALITALTTMQVRAQEGKEGSECGQPSKKEMKKHQNKDWGTPDNQERMKHVVQLLASLPESERARLEQLKKENPEAFRTEVQKLFKERKEKRIQEDAKLQELAAKYREAASDEEKQKILAEIKTETEKEFTAKMEANKKFIEQAEKRLEEFKKKCEARREKASEIIDERVKELTKDPALKWDSKH